MNRRSFMLNSTMGGVALAALSSPNSFGQETGNASSLPTGPSTSKKVYMVTDMEGVDGIAGLWEEQCDPFRSPRWAESQKLLTDEVNAAVDGLFAGGATEVVVADLHDSSRSLSVATIDSRAQLIQGRGLPPTLGLDATYSAVIFIGQHPMAGATNGILSHTQDFSIQNIWVNNKLVGELGERTMLAGYFGVPVIMLSGDKAACDELLDLVPNAECAAVKFGFSRTAGRMLSHPAALKLIREKTQRAMERLPEIKPYRVSNPVEVKIQFTVTGINSYRPRGNPERVDDRTYIYRGKDIVEAWTQMMDF
ncbi:MAG: M55 family metallopeptidase [Terriglobia bacterium]